MPHLLGQLRRRRDADSSRSPQVASAGGYSSEVLELGSVALHRRVSCGTVPRGTFCPSASALMQRKPSLTSPHHDVVQRRSVTTGVVQPSQKTWAAFADSRAATGLIPRADVRLGPLGARSAFDTATFRRHRHRRRDQARRRAGLHHGLLAAAVGQPARLGVQMHAPASTRPRS